MSKRLEILKSSLKKKEAVLNASFETHFNTVKRANGQPLNDKRNGYKTLAKWERQNETIRRNQKEIEKTKNAIEREESKIKACENALSDMPLQIVALMNDGTLNQWRKYPTIFFVDGVEKARIQYSKGVLSHKYTSKIKDKEQFAKFRDTFNNLKKDLTS